HRFCALLAQSQVVFTAASVVGVTFDHDLAARRRLDEAGMRLDQRLELRLDDVAVVVEIDDAAHAHGAGGVVGRLVEIDACHTAPGGISRVGAAVGVPGGGGALVFNGLVVQLHARAATGHQCNHGKGEGKTFDHPEFS